MDCHARASLAMTVGAIVVIARIRVTGSCHCEERSDVAIHIRQQWIKMIAYRICLIS